MSNRFHNKFHRYSHHTTKTAGIPDAGYDPIASPDAPFLGDFHINGSLITTFISAMSADITYLNIISYELSAFDIKGPYTDRIINNTHYPVQLTISGVGVSGNNWASFYGDIQTENDLYVSGNAIVRNNVSAMVFSTSCGNSDEWCNVSNGYFCNKTIKTDDISACNGTLSISGDIIVDNFTQRSYSNVTNSYNEVFNNFGFSTDNSLLFVNSGTNIDCYSVSSVDNIYKISSVTLTAYANYFRISGNNLFATCSDRYIQIVDFSNPLTPVKKGMFDLGSIPLTPWLLSNFTLESNTLVMINQEVTINDMFFFDVSDINNISYISASFVGRQAINVASYNNVVYTGPLASDFKSYAISGTQLDTLLTPVLGAPALITPINNNLVIFTGTNYRTQIVKANISDPANLSKIGEITLPDSMYSITKDINNNNFVYIGTNNGKIYVVDVINDVIIKVFNTGLGGVINIMAIDENYNLFFIFNTDLYVYSLLTQVKIGGNVGIGSLSSTNFYGNVYTNSGNSFNWDNNYSLTTATSASWDQATTIVELNSAKWNGSFCSTLLNVWKLSGCEDWEVDGLDRIHLQSEVSASRGMITNTLTTNNLTINSVLETSGIFFSTGAFLTLTINNSTLYLPLYRK